ncbi:transposase [Neisseria weixii]|uniref:transposase n=1 Tax=Neisseria weixii TaxID=1853276 RepID=UPI00359F2664
MTEPKFRQILRLFAFDLIASDTAKLTRISVSSINSLYLKLRRCLADECEQHTLFCGIVELDKSYFGARCIRGKRERRAGGKTIVFGILKRGGKVYTEIVPDASKATLQKVISGIESFWSYAKYRLVQFNGVSKHTFYLHLKETGFRFNHRHNDLYKVLLKMLREDPLK